MITVHPYLNFNGNTEEAFAFYKSVFGGEFMEIYRFATVSGLEHLSEKEKNCIMHIALPVGKGTILMGTDTLDSMNQHATFGNNVSLSIDTDTLEEAQKLFEGLSEGGVVLAPFKMEFREAYRGHLQDKFGVLRMINFDPKKNS